MSSDALNQEGKKPLIAGKKSILAMIVLWTFVIIPFLAIVSTGFMAWGGWFSWVDLSLMSVLYTIAGLGATVGLHRYFTHGSFKAKRWLRIVLGVAGLVVIEGPITQWVANHRRHHAFPDREGDPHSPWRFGTGVWALTKGLFYAHVGWMNERKLTNHARFAPDLLADKDIRRIDRLFPYVAFTSFVLPAVLGGLMTWSWQGALTAFFWAGLVRIGLLHHATWSINSICHVVGERKYKTAKEGDKATNFWPLAIISFGESWHNSHHADPTCARHGVDRGQIDISARVIWIFEKFGWAWDVRWPKKERFETLRIKNA